MSAQLMISGSSFIFASVPSDYMNCLKYFPIARTIELYIHKPVDVDGQIGLTFQSLKFIRYEFIMRPTTLVHTHTHIFFVL